MSDGDKGYFIVLFCTVVVVCFIVEAITTAHWRKEAVEAGVADYAPDTGEWRWIEAPGQPREEAPTSD